MEGEEERKNLLKKIFGLLLIRDLSLVGVAVTVINLFNSIAISKISTTNIVVFGAAIVGLSFLYAFMTKKILKFL